jgi:hypothetical protein
MDKKEDQSNTNRTSVYIVGVVLLIAAVVGLIIAHNNAKDHTSQAASQASSMANSQANAHKACKTFTLADAKQILGQTAKGGEGTNRAESANINVSACIYMQDSGSNAAVSSKKIASLLVRSAETTTGAQSNQTQFSRLKPADAVNVEGYGDGAYWDVKLAQLHILKNNNWYILTVGSPVAASRTLDETKQLADLLINKM